MRISLNTIKSYVQIPATVSNQELIELIGSRLVEIEEVIDLEPRYRGCYVVKVVNCEPIPDTHLSLCQIDAGAHNSEFNQLENGLVQVVCGAPNVHAGMLAVWITPGAIVPETYGNENFKLSVRKLRGYESNGMLAGADELGFDTEHKAIAEIDPKTAQPGDALSDVFDLNDLILDVENKSLTHRPDCFGLIGFAREVAGILGIRFQEPEVFAHLQDAKLASSKQVELEVKIADAELCPRYSCAVFDLPKHEQSKYLTTTAIFLAKAGMRSIDPMVDLTNVLMLETGQPLHAFDYDKLVSVGGSKTPKIIVRAAENGEPLQLLDGKTITCMPDDILITSNNVPVALAGAMGGKNTDIDASTTRVVLESATFSLYRLRKTQMAHGIFSEAITRFTKGQPAAITLPVLAEAVRRLGVEPLAVDDEYPAKSPETVVKITTGQANNLLGTSYDTSTIVETLENVGFKVGVERGASWEGAEPAGEHAVRESRKDGHERHVSQEGTTLDTRLKVTSPVWRTDIHIAEDVIEEVGRLLGYDNIPLALPTKPFLEPEIDAMVRLKQELREILSGHLQMNELLTYSFVHRDLITKVGKDPEDCYQIVNSISPDLQCFRSEIAPSLLDKVRENLKAGHQGFTLYEMNQVARKGSGLTDEGTPVTKTHLGVVATNDFYTLKAQILAMFAELKIPVEYALLSSETASHHPYLEPKRSAELFLAGQNIGAFGEVKASVLRQFKLDQVISAAEINLDKIAVAPRVLQAQVQLSKFPSVERDLTLKVAGDAPFGRIATAIDESLSQQELYYSVTPISIYQAPTDKSTKNLSFHLKFSSPRQTLNATEISAIMDKIAKDVSAVGATIV